MTIEVEAPEPRRVATDAQLRGRFALLRSIRPSDYDFLYDIATAPRTVIGWRFRGAPPPPEQFPGVLWQGVLTQFVVCHAGNGGTAGLVTAYGADMRNGCVSLAVVIDERLADSGWTMEGAILFIDFLFSVWSFRKIYIEALEFNLAKFKSGIGRLFEVEGCLRDHEYHDGKYWHKYYLAIHADRWQEASAAYRWSSVQDR